MKEKDKQAYLQKYKVAKEKGVPFYPDALFKDAVVSLVIFIFKASGLGMFKYNVTPFSIGCIVIFTLI